MRIDGLSVGLSAWNRYEKQYVELNEGFVKGASK